MRKSPRSLGIREVRSSIDVSPCQTFLSLFRSGEQLIVVTESDLQVWSNEIEEVESRGNRVNFELESSETSAKNSIPIQRVWKQVWNYK